jgi:hypothetical protein
VTGPDQTGPRPTLHTTPPISPRISPATSTTDPAPILTSSLPPICILPYPRLPSSSPFPAQPPTHRLDPTRLIISSHPIPTRTKPNQSNPNTTAYNALTRPRKPKPTQPSHLISSRTTFTQNTDHPPFPPPLSAHSLHVHVCIHVYFYPPLFLSLSRIHHPRRICVCVSVFHHATPRHATPHHATSRRASNTSGAEPRTRLWCGKRVSGRGRRRGGEVWWVWWGEVSV